MRNFIVSILVLGTVGYLSYLTYEYLSEDFSLKDPVRIELKNSDGRSSIVTLLARNNTHIEFTRDDQEKFVYPIASLA